MRVLIIDDEKPARDRLRRLLSGIADVTVVGEAPNAQAALSHIEELQPDAIFLDVQMPGQSGFDLAASLPEPAPMIVFVTAYDRYALQAFDTAAIDYLLKPIELERLQRALQRLRDRSQMGAARTKLAPAQLLIPDRGRTRVVNVADIAWLEAADNYVMIHVAPVAAHANPFDSAAQATQATPAPLLRRTLSALLQDLGDGFVRTHRGAAVAIAQVQELRSRGKGDSEITLRGGALVPCSRQYRASLLARLTPRSTRLVPHR